MLGPIYVSREVWRPNLIHAFHFPFPIFLRAGSWFFFLLNIDDAKSPKLMFKLNITTVNCALLGSWNSVVFYISIYTNNLRVETRFGWGLLSYAGQYGKPTMILSFT
jgi:hypothetical protein